jgi:pimeloyl-ACP methyl ester carboxylesterase
VNDSSTPAVPVRGLAEIVQEGERVRLEYRRIEAADAAAPLLVFLHEGLGSLSAWRDFPDRLCAAAGLRGLVYSRAGYGGSTPRPHARRWRPDFMHIQAHEALPALLAALRVDVERAPPWLFGHSDGASIALLHAGAFPRNVAGVIAVAPHVFVEDLSVRSIERARDLYRTTDLRERLARHHADVDSAFWGWNDIWLDPAFRGWNIEAALPAIRCAVLAVQGHDDEYGTMAQIDRIAAGVPQAELLKLDRCGHAVHRDQPQALLEATTGFIARHRRT